MKKTGTFFLLSMWSFILTLMGTHVGAQVVISAHNTSVNTNFNGWNGTMPNGFVRSSNNNYMGTAATTTGGVYAIPNMGFGYQPSSNASATTTSVTGTFRNNTGETITQLKVTYDAFKIVHRDARIPCWTVNVSSGVFGTNLNWCSDQANTTKTFTSPVNIANGATFTITFNSDRGTGSQSSPLIGFNNIRVESIQTGCTPPAAPLADPQSFCGPQTIADLFADGTDLKWYDTEDSTTALTADHILQSKDYFVTQTISDCESEKTRVPVSINEIPAAPVAEAQSFCGEATVADLVPASVEGAPADIATESWSGFITGTGGFSGTQILASNFAYNFTQFTHAPANGYPIAQAHAVEMGISARLLYGVNSVSFELAGVGPGGSTNKAYVSKIVNGTETTLATLDLTSTLSIYTIYVNEPQTNGVIVKIIKDASLSYIQIPTIEYDFHEGVSTSWYEEEIGGSPLTEETVLETGIYYVSQTINGCESERTPVEVTINEAPAAPVAEAQAFCGAAAVADLDAEGTNLAWYDVIDGTTPLTEETALQSGTYYVEQSANDCVSERTAVEVTINEIPAAPTAEAQAFCGEATVADLDAEGTNLAWYDVIDGTTPLTEETALQSGTYYVEQSANDCISERTAVEITINEIPTAPVAEAQAFCGEATVADLDAEGTNLAWYDAIDATTPLTDDTSLGSGTYYVEQSANDCISERTAVEVTINEIPAAPVAEAQAFCGEATVADLDAEGTNLTWYDAIDATTPLTDDTSLESGTYYVEQSANDCISERTAVEITINETPAAPEAQDQSFCGEATVADLDAGGTNLAWYDAIDATTPLTDDTSLESGTYYVSQSSDDCESVRIPIEVTVNEIADAPVAPADQNFTQGDTLEDLTVDGENLTWYDEDGNVIDPFTELVDGTTYYVTQTTDGCESEPTAITVHLTLSVNDFDSDKITYYPNPVKDILYISNENKIDNVLVLDLSGKLIMEKKANTKSIELNLSHLASATYIIKVVTNNQVKAVKVIKK